MSGGALVSDFIPAQRCRRLTADYLWPDLKKSPGKHSKRQAESEAVGNARGDFEADFQDFKDEPDVKDNLEADIAPSALSATAPEPRRRKGDSVVAKALRLLCCCRCFRDSTP